MWMLPDENKVVLCLYTPALPSVREMDGIYIYIYMYMPLEGILFRG